MRHRFEAVRQYGMMLLGCLIGAASYPLFLEPNHIAPGGLTGLTTILNFHFGLPIGLTSLALNIPLFIIGWRYIGRRFVLRTLMATALFSVLIDLLVFAPVVLDPMLSAIFGGVMLGAGLALIMRGSATTGGTDLLARIVHKKVPAVSIGAILFFLDLLVILLAWLFMSVQYAMYAIICVYISSRVLDQILIGIGLDKACYVISVHHEKIARRLMDDMERGVTLIHASGAYSGQETRMLLCVVGRMEVMEVKQIVREEDPAAFVFITETHQTLGEGFENLNGEEI